MKTLTLVHSTPERAARLVRCAGLAGGYAGVLHTERDLRALDGKAATGRSIFAVAASAAGRAAARAWARQRRYRLHHLCLADVPPDLRPDETVDRAPDLDSTQTRRALRDRLLAHIAPPVVDFDRFRQIVMIGDIHGCDATLAAFLDHGPARDDTGYVFLGDYISKGPASAAVLRRLMRGYAGRDNVVMMAGNHETPLETWVRGGRVRSRCFNATTLPDLRAAGLTQGIARDFADTLVEARWIRWRGYTILASHGGFDRKPASLALLGTRECRLGRPATSPDIDAAWARNTATSDDPGLIQVHGHRNDAGRPVAAAPGSFNLEGRVEAGGALRALVATDTDGRCHFRTVALPTRDPITAFMRERAADAAA